MHYPQLLWPSGINNSGPNYKLEPKKNIYHPSHGLRINMYVVQLTHSFRHCEFLQLQGFLGLLVVIVGRGPVCVDEVVESTPNREDLHGLGVHMCVLCVCVCVCVCVCMCVCTCVRELVCMCVY